MKKHGGTTVLFAVDAKTGMCLSMIVPAKGVANPWISQRLANWINDLGDLTATIKADNERPIKALMEEVRRARGPSETTLIEPVLEGDKQSNSHGEGAVNILKGIIRTLVSSVSEKLGETMEPGASHHALARRARRSCAQPFPDPRQWPHGGREP